jgi:hypothetical protein
VSEGHPHEGIWAGASAPADLNSRQPEEIPDLFAGVRKYGLLGLVWFDDVTSYDYRITSPAAIAAFRRAAQAYIRPTP